jgi:hypothetical protein
MSMFKTAKAIETTPAKKAADKKDQVALPGLLHLAEIDALMKSLAGLKTTLEQEVKAEGFDHFFDVAQKTGKRPDNFRGVDGIATASIEMRKRSTASALSEEEQALFEKHNLPTQKVVSVQKLFGINPAFANDDALLEKVSVALEGIVPDNFIVVQEEKFKIVVGDETMDAAFTNKAPREIIEAITVMAIKPKLESTDIAKIINDVKGMLLPKKAADSAQAE